MGEAGRIRRGYFVEGLGGSQFALPGAVDRLRDLREPDAHVIALAACDPANSYGSVLPWPRSDGRMARAAGAYCVLEGGRLVLYLERGGRSLLTNGEVSIDHLRALIAMAVSAGRGGRACGGGPPAPSWPPPPTHPVVGGFSPRPRRATRGPPRRRGSHLIPSPL